MDLSFEALRPEYEELWAKVIVPGGIRPDRLVDAKREARAIIDPRAKVRFDSVEQLTGVPWFVTGIISTREGGSPPNFHAWLHNGDPMFDHTGKPRQTVDVPSHRPPDPACSWEDGACDAYTIEGLIHKNCWSPAFVAWVLEKFNGWGYREWHHMPSPYVWGSTVVQTPGKYVKDHDFDPTEMDTQIGGMALLAALMQIDPSVKFTTATESFEKPPGVA
jgi:lysozyme family protein